MNAPKLRFKEFNDEWITYKFYDLVSIINGQVDPNKKEYCNLPHIGPGNIEKETGRLLEYNLAKDDKLISSKYLFNEKSVIYGKINPHFAKVCYPKFVGLCSADSYPINPIEEKLTSTFLLYLLLNPKFTKFATSVSMRTGMPKINRDELGIYKFTIPKINEQIKIGDFLSLLDKKIELQSKKIEDLKLFKLSKYSSVFSKTNNKIKLSDICIIEKGKQINSDLLIENGNYYMLNGGILPSGYLNEYNTNENTITISEGGNSCGYVNFNKTKFWCGGHCYKIISPSVNTSYLYHLLKYNEKKIMDLRVGSGLPNIQKKDLEALKLSINKNDEQLKIGILFDTFDKKINLETNKLDKLQERVCQEKCVSSKNYIKY